MKRGFASIESYDHLEIGRNVLDFVFGGGLGFSIWLDLDNDIILSRHIEYIVATGIGSLLPSMLKVHQLHSFPRPKTCYQKISDRNA